MLAKKQGVNMELKKDFPYGRLIWAMFLGGSTTFGAGSSFVLGAIIQLCFSIIPILVAYNKNLKHKQAIYNLSTIFPVTILVIIAVIWALVEQPITEKNSHEKQSVDNDNTEIKNKTIKNKTPNAKKTGWQGSSSKVGGVW